MKQVTFKEIQVGAMFADLDGWIHIKTNNTRARRRYSEKYSYFHPDEPCKPIINCPPYAMRYIKHKLLYTRRYGTECVHCGVKFFPTNERGPVPKYCGHTCRVAANRQKQIEQESAWLQPEGYIGRLYVPIEEVSR